MASTAVQDMETASVPDGSIIKDFMEQYGNEENSFLSGDTFTLPGLKEMPGLKLVEAKSEEIPEYDERDEEVYGDVDIQIKVIVHGDASVYGADDKSKEQLLTDVQDWLLGEQGDTEHIKVLKKELVRSEPTYHEVNATIIMDSYIMSDLLGDVVDSPFHQNFWNKHMQKIISEGICYVKGKVPDELKKRLQGHLDEVAHKNPIDYHPKSNDIVRDLIHPALYPYIKGVSRVKKDAELPQEPAEGEAKDFWGREYEDSKFQWLPAPFEISNQGNCKIQDYINNLDRALFPGLYQDLEELFDIFLPYFQDVWSYAKAMDFFTGGDDEDELTPQIQKEAVSFKGQELQIIVKVVEYILQPDQSYEGVWHAEGMSHENIVMTGIYFLDRSHDISGGDLRFKRAFTVAERNRVFWEIPQGRPAVVNQFASEGFIPLGYIPTEEGHLLVFPNCHIHKISKMINNSANKGSASRRIVVFFFVNPEKKIVSSREVAAQQNDIPLSAAKEYRLELMAQRKYDKEKLNIRDIELCEH